MRQRGVLIFVWVTFVFGASVAQAVPPTPCDWWGESTTFDGTGIGEADMVTAKDPDGVSCGTQYHWGDSGQYAIHVAGDDPDTPEDEGAGTGDVITFFINGHRAAVVSGSPVWEAGGGSPLELAALTPTVASVDPDSLSSGIARGVTVAGAGFWATPAVDLVAGAEPIALTGVVFVHSAELTATVPAGTPLGTYDVVVTNPDGQSAVLEEGLTVIASELVSIQVTPSPLDSMVVDTLRHVPSTLQYTATGTYVDGGTSDITFEAVWTSSDTTVATVDSVGLASSVSPGDSVWIKADVDGIADSTLLKVAALGDVQCDADVDGADARLAVKIIVHRDPYDVPERPTVFELDAADFMPDYPPVGDAINVFDVVGIVRHRLVPGWVPPAWPVSKPVFDEEVLLVVAKAVVPEHGAVSIPIEIATYRPMAAAEIRLRYDPAALSLVAPQLTARTEGMSLSYRASENGELRIVLYSLTGDAIPVGSGPVLRLAFDARGAEPAHLGVDEVVLADEMGRSVPVRITDVESEAVHAVPAAYELRQNFPNPFNASTTIAFHLSEEAQVRLSVYNPDGQRVRCLVDEVRHAGRYSVVWDGKDEAGHAVASGVYFYRLRTAGDLVRTKRMVLLK